MSIRHHPSDISLMSYASGALSPGLSLAVGAHASVCALCRASIAGFEEAGGAYLDTLEPSALEANALSRVQEQLNAPVRHADPAPMPATEFDSLPLPASVRAYGVGKRQFLAPGIWMAPILQDRKTGARALILGAAPGRKLPEHGHRGVEMTCVLTGSFTDKNGTYGPGDVLEIDEDTDHQPVIGEMECICLIANDAPPRFHNIFGWALQSIFAGRSS